MKINIQGDKRAGFTILGTISSEGDKFPLALFAKGKQKRCHKQLGNHPNHNYKVFHSESGWVTEQTFCEYLAWIRGIVGSTKKIYLVVDQFGAHFGSSVEEKASELKIILIPVPKGGTSTFQPLDRGIFGIMKRKGVSKWIQKNHENPDMKWTKEEAAAIALECWDEITKYHIISAWNFEEDLTSSGSSTNESDGEFLPEKK